MVLYLNCHTVTSVALCRCQSLAFEHLSEYQKVLFKFLEATETFDPNAISLSVTMKFNEMLDDVRV